MNKLELMIVNGNVKTKDQGTDETIRTGSGE